MLPEFYSVGAAGSLRVYPTDRFKSGTLSVTSVLPINRENACLAPLMLSVLRRGTGKYPTLAALNRRLDYLYGTAFSVRSYYRGNLLVLGFSAELLDRSYLPADAEDLTDAVLELMKEILCDPILDEDGLLSAKYVESEKSLQCDTIRAMKNSPRSYATDQCLQHFYDGEPCGIPFYGTEEETKAVTREQLTAYWKHWLAGFRPDCFYVGPADPAGLREKLERTFGSFDAEKLRLNGTALHRDAGRGDYLNGQLPVSQSHLVIGLRGAACVNDPAFFACAVMNELLGNSPISKLFVHVREKLSLCYSCASTYSPFMGTVLITCGLKAENRERAEKEIFRQLRAVADGRFTNEELEAAIGALVNGYRQLEDSPADIENYFYSRALMGNSLTPEDCRNGFLRVSAEDVKNAARKLTVDTVYFLEGTLAGDADAEEDDDASEI